MIYLDNNATTRIDPIVLEEMCGAWLQPMGNPASQHRPGRDALKRLERARRAILESVDAAHQGMGADQLLFTSGGTESNNLALRGMLAGRVGALVVSGIEHASILGVAEYLASRGRHVRTLPVTSSGCIDLACLAAWIEEHRQADPDDPQRRIAMVSAMMVNNETGIVQPIAEAARWCREAGILIHSDAVQALGKVSVSFRDLQLDAMTIASHKLHGPVGIGGLILRSGVELQPQAWGGFQQSGLRPGTEAVPLAIGFAKGVELAMGPMRTHIEHLVGLRDRFEAGVLAFPPSFPSSVIIGRDQVRAPHTCCVSWPRLDRQSIQMALDMAGVACSTGSACASGSSQPSHVLRAMGLEESVVQGAVRFSFSRQNRMEEIDRAVEVIGQTIPKLLRTGA